jgi:hypothetical protein
LPGKDEPVTPDAATLKHLDFLQAAIARMGSHSFAIKGWGITISTAILAVGTKEGDARYFAVGLLPVLLFWGLDSYFLVLERRFRALFKTVASGNGAATFDMSPGAIKIGDVATTMARPALLAVHGTLLMTLMAARALTAA